ncbi:MAG: M24 family metallopeptidase, partial [Planctomycetaceae bacterium]
ALLLTKPSNFSWFTVGGDSSRGQANDVTAALFLTQDARVIATRNTDSSQIFDREISGLGFQLKERLWQEDREVLMGDLCRGRNVACDYPFEHCVDASVHLRNMRLPLSKLEVRNLRETGAQIAHAVEATARTLQQGESETEIAGQLAHRMLRHNIWPERLQIFCDGQSQRYRHWSFSADPVEKLCTLLAIGRRNGLHVGVSRTVCFGACPTEAREMYLSNLLVQATGMFFAQTDWEIHEAWKRIERIYEKYGHSEEWHVADQGCLTGYELCEAPITPTSQFRLEAGMPVFLCPSISTAMAADTILIKTKGFEVVTPMESWPQIEVDVKGVKIPRPDVLIRPE